MRTSKVTDATWSQLLPPAVIVVDGPVADAVEGERDVAALFPEERAQVEKAVAKRRSEFAAGRACAHQALARLGVARAPLLNGSDRAPQWPAGVVGTISHGSSDPSQGLPAARWCAAAVARSADVAALGIDLEPAAPLEPSLWKMVATPRERAWLDRLPEDQRGAHARLLFSAKEAFYKCQYGSTRTLLDFHDVELDFDADAGAADGEFHATLQRIAGPLARGARFTGRYASDGGWWITAMTWPAR